jgi:PKD repeat protein
MAEEKEGVKSAVKGWIKGLMGSIVGLASGAALMYLTPLVNNAIKPAKPVSNFAAQVVGLSVNFNNRSTGAVQGWWDFGDGSALEPFDPKVETIAHSYAKPGAYTVKLSLQNLLGDESERSTTVTPESTAAPAKVDFASFKLEQAVPGQSALYRLQADVAGASHCILCAGDNRPMEIIDEPGHIERIITFDGAGKYTFRLVAMNGKQVIEKTQDVQVGAGETGGLMAKLKVNYEAVRVQRYTKTVHIHVGWLAGLQDPVSAFRKERPIDPDCTIVELDLVNKSDVKAPRKLDCKPSPDKKKILLTGELVRPAGLLTPKQTAPSWLAEVKTTMERRSQPEFVHRDAVTMAVDPGRAVKIPLQPLGDRWELIRAQLTLELWDNGHMIWSGEPPIANATLTWKNQAMTLTAARQSDSVLVTIATAASVPAIPVVLPRPTPVELPPLPAPAPTMVIPPPAAAQPVGPIRLRIDFDARRPFAPAANR